MDNKSVKDICEECVKDNELIKACNKFVLEVARLLGEQESLPKDANADAMFEYVQNRNGWTTCDKKTAVSKAEQGSFVLGVANTELRKTAEPKATKGHVVVIVGGGLSTNGKEKLADGSEQGRLGGYPYCYQGSELKKYQFHRITSVDVVFHSKIKDKITYAYKNRQTISKAEFKAFTQALGRA